MPKNIRNITDASVKKKIKLLLDKFLATVPDEPQIVGYIYKIQKSTN